MDGPWTLFILFSGLSTNLSELTHPTPTPGVEGEDRERQGSPSQEDGVDKMATDKYSNFETN